MTSLLAACLQCSWSAGNRVLRLHPASYSALYHSFSTSSSPNQAKDREPTSRPSIIDNLPKSWVSYAQLARLDKPIGTWLLFWPSAWSIAMAAPPGHLPDLHLLALFGAGSVLLRGAGCTINDLWDKDYDRQVERTKTRPLASGALSTGQAIGFLALQLSLGLMILLQLNDYSKLIGASSLLLVGTYPLFKRFTYWPQAFLGLTINWGVLLGYAAATGTLNWHLVLPLYVGCIFWTLTYDTIYAHQDREDDVKAGVKSTALLFGTSTKIYLSSFAFIATGAWLAAGIAADLTLPYTLSVLGASSHLAWQIREVDLDSRGDCMSKFVSNKWVGALIIAGIVMGR